MFARNRTLRSLCCVSSALSLSVIPASAATLYVKTTGTGDCSTWANACLMGTALTLGNSQTNDEIWVQAGTYGPFALKTGIKIYGGFAGTETAVSQSNPAVNVTIIDGGGATQCVTGNGESAATILRGFTLRNGRDQNGEGGAIVLQSSSAIIVNTVFEENSATYFGGAVTIRGTGSPQFINCTFRKNGTAATNPRDTLGGGAVYVDEGSPLFVNCLFHNNKAGQGGVVLVRQGSPTFVNCTMADNESYYQPGGAISDNDGGVTLKNCILWNNTRMFDSDGYGGADPVPVLDQVSTGSGGTTLATYCDIQGGWGVGWNNINVDPQFANPAAGSYALQVTSPCKDVGENAALPPDSGDLDWDVNTIEQIPKDLGFLLRVRYGIVDLGAHEILTGGGGGGGG